MRTILENFKTYSHSQILEVPQLFYFFRSSRRSGSVPTWLGSGGPSGNSGSNASRRTASWPPRGSTGLCGKCIRGSPIRETGVPPPEPPSSIRSRKKGWVTFRPTRQSLNNKTGFGFNLFRERFKSGKWQQLCVNNETKILFVFKRVPFWEMQRLGVKNNETYI